LARVEIRMLIFDILGVASKEVSWINRDTKKGLRLHIVNKKIAKTYIKGFAIVNSKRLHCVRSVFVLLEKASRQSF
jgi:hypothetical protein